jgi:hypothetical protein
MKKDGLEMTTPSRNRLESDSERCSLDYDKGFATKDTCDCRKDDNATAVDNAATESFRCRKARIETRRARRDNDSRSQQRHIHQRLIISSLISDPYSQASFGLRRNTVRPSAPSSAPNSQSLHPAPAPHFQDRRPAPHPDPRSQNRHSPHQHHPPAPMPPPAFVHYQAIARRSRLVMVSYA